MTQSFFAPAGFGSYPSAFPSCNVLAAYPLAPKGPMSAGLSQDSFERSANNRGLIHFLGKPDLGEMKREFLLLDGRPGTWTTKWLPWVFDRQVRHVESLSWSVVPPSLATGEDVDRLRARLFSVYQHSPKSLMGDVVFRYMLQQARQQDRELREPLLEKIHVASEGAPLPSAYYVENGLNGTDSVDAQKPWSPFYLAQRSGTTPNGLLKKGIFGDEDFVTLSLGAFQRIHEIILENGYAVEETPLYLKVPALDMIIWNPKKPPKPGESDYPGYVELITKDPECSNPQILQEFPSSPRFSMEYMMGFLVNLQPYLQAPPSQWPKVQKHIGDPDFQIYLGYEGVRKLAKGIDRMIRSLGLEHDFWYEHISARYGNLHKMFVSPETLGILPRGCSVEEAFQGLDKEWKRMEGVMKALIKIAEVQFKDEIKHFPIGEPVKPHWQVSAAYLHDRLKVIEREHGNWINRLFPDGIQSIYDLTQRILPQGQLEDPPMLPSSIS